MAQIEVKVPQLSESVAEATLLSWHKKVGEAVSRDENMIDIETDKVVLELPAPSAGVIVQLIKADGATVVAGEVIAIIDTEASAQTSPIGITAAPVANAPAAAAAPQASASTAGRRRQQGRRRHAGRRQDPGRQQHEHRRCHRHRP
jgi:2-oxoglutarate dehydrogenase E2 component (dihydrolipoamide succinyltransferase)